MLTAVELSDAVRRGELTARAATEQALHRIASHDHQLRAFRQVRAAAALIEADQVDARPDRDRLPLAGVPLAVKDNVAVSGEATGNGSAGSDLSAQAADHEIVHRLRCAGAVIVGMTNVGELCTFGATDFPAIGATPAGITRNPWDPDRSPGGSSGGSAAAVAAGLVVAAHGNDGMGSIRIPAACTGLVGIKPGSDVVPAALGNGSWFGMAENGSLATTVADCALLLSVLAGRPELAAVQPPPSLRISVSVRAPVLGVPVDRGYVQAARRAGELLAGAGNQVTERELRYPVSAGPAALARWFAGTELDARLLADRSQVDRRIATHSRLGRAVLATSGPRSGGRDRWRRAAEKYFEQADVLITPALAQRPLAALAWRQKGWASNVQANIRYAPFAAPWNLAGWPAMVVPAGQHASGLPLSVQLVGPPGSEARLLAVAGELERLQPWARVAPGFG